MRISSTSLALLALSPLSMANGAKPLSRQLGHALESIQEQQSSTKSLKFKKMVRALQDQTDTDEMPQEYLDAFGPELVAMLPCIGALFPMGDDMEMGDGGGDGNQNNPLDFLEDYKDNACDATGNCDFSIAKDEAKIKCDETGGKIISNDILYCKEDFGDDVEGAPDMDVIYNNAPVCFPQICPDDSNVIELGAMASKMFIISLAMAFGTEVDMDMEEMGPGMKEECASGTKLATSDNGGGSSAAARNIIWSFSVAAAVGIGAFLAV